VLISEREASLLVGDTRPTRTLEPGDRVGSLEVVAAEGHSPGQIALLDVRDRTLYCADAFTTFGGVETTARRNLRFPFAAMATADRPRALESARRLRSLEPTRLAPGHGRVVESPLAAMDAAIARAG
jgi:glyoxylase-like metal-dependent hydrolase (beta-lactamase superfamily II)